MSARFHWLQAQEILLKEEVAKRPLLVDPALSNNSKLREAAWQEVTLEINLNFGLNLTHMQVRKKFNDAKYNGKVKVTMEIENGTKDDGRLVARSWGEFRRFGRGTEGGKPMSPPSFMDEDEAEIPNVEGNFMLADLPPTFWKKEDFCI